MTLQYIDNAESLFTFERQTLDDLIVISKEIKDLENKKIELAQRLMNVRNFNSN